MGDVLTITIMSVALAMDAFAVTVSNAMCYENLTKKQKLSMPLLFGLFQGLMPLLGYLLGSLFAEAVKRVDHWIALVLLLFLGGKMLFEAIKEKTEQRRAASRDETDEKSGEICAEKRKFSVKTLLVQAVATSIDALAVGVTLAVSVELSVYICAGVIAGITFLISLAGLFIGKTAGKLLKDYSGVFGGLILIAIGLKIFIEHMMGVE